MKKYLLLLIMIVVMPIMVFADAAGPAIIGYEAVIINKDGVKVEIEDGKVKTIPYNTKVYVDYEEDGKVSFCEKIDEGRSCMDSYMTKSSNVAPLKKEIKPADVMDSNNGGTHLEKGNYSFIILNKKGIKLSKGPAGSYDKYDKVIPYKEVVSASYCLDRGLNEISWCYIDSYKGWLNPDENVGIDRGEMFTFGTTDLLDEEGNVIDKVKSETVISKAYSVYYEGNSYDYINYKGKYGYVKSSETFNLGVKGTIGYVLTMKETKMTSGDGSVVKTIPAYEIAKILYGGMEDTWSDSRFHSTYCINDQYYVEYDGQKGYISYEDVNSLPYELRNKKLTLKQDTKFYEIDIFGKQMKKNERIADFAARFKVLDTIPKGETIQLYDWVDLYVEEPYETADLYIVKYNNKFGCIIIQQGDEPTDSTPTPVATTTPTATPVIASEETPVVSPEASKEETSSEDNKATPTSKPDNIIIICIVISVIVSVASIVTTIIINKKNKEKLAKEIAKVKSEAQPTENTANKQEQPSDKPVDNTANNQDMNNDKKEE